MRRHRRLVTWVLVVTKSGQVGSVCRKLRAWTSVGQAGHTIHKAEEQGGYIHQGEATSYVDRYGCYHRERQERQMVDQKLYISQ
jgi:hypothetical protein